MPYNGKLYIYDACPKCKLVDPESGHAAAVPTSYQKA